MSSSADLISPRFALFTRTVGSGSVAREPPAFWRTLAFKSLAEGPSEARPVALVSMGPAALALAFAVFLAMLPASELLEVWSTETMRFDAIKEYRSAPRCDTDCMARGPRGRKRE